jgi:hypothetical protein
MFWYKNVEGNAIRGRICLHCQSLPIQLHFLSERLRVCFFCLRDWPVLSVTLLRVGDVQYTTPFLSLGDLVRLIVLPYASSNTLIPPGL